MEIKTKYNYGDYVFWLKHSPSGWCIYGPAKIISVQTHTDQVQQRVLYNFSSESAFESEVFKTKEEVSLEYDRRSGNLETEDKTISS